MNLKQDPTLRGKRLVLPIRGFSISEIVGEARPRLVFNDPRGSVVDVHGAFQVDAAGTRDVFEPLDPAAVPVLESLQLVEISDARASRRGELEIRFADDRILAVPDGPYESWHYSNSDGLRISIDRTHWATRADDRRKLEAILAVLGDVDDDKLRGAIRVYRQATD